MPRGDIIQDCGECPTSAGFAPTPSGSRPERLPAPMLGQAGPFKRDPAISRGGGNARIPPSNAGPREPVQDSQFLRTPNGTPEPAVHVHKAPAKPPPEATLSEALVPASRPERLQADAQGSLHGPVSPCRQRHAELPYGFDVLLTPPFKCLPAKSPRSGFDKVNQSVLGSSPLQPGAGEGTKAVGNRGPAAGVSAPSQSPAEAGDDAQLFRAEGRIDSGRDVSQRTRANRDAGTNGAVRMSGRKPGPRARSLVAARRGRNVTVLPVRERRGVAFEQPQLIVRPQVLPPRQAEIVSAAQKSPGRCRIGTPEIRPRPLELALTLGQRLCHVPIPATDDCAGKAVNDAVLSRKPWVVDNARHQLLISPRP